MNIIHISFVSVFLIVAVVLVRILAINKLPKKVFIAVWLILMLRLLLPFSFPTPIPVSSIPVVSIPQNLYINTQSVLPVFNETPQTSSYIDNNDISTPIKTPSYNLYQILTVVWLAGIIISASFFILTHLRHKRDYKAALPVKCDYISDFIKKHELKRKVRVLQSDKINAPLTYGLLKPVILFPKSTSWQDKHRLEYILTHELTHIKRCDIVFKWLLAITLCVHWFNPFVWIMFILANRDIEMSCDEAVVHELGEMNKSTYAMTLIGLEESKSSYFSLCSSFSKNIIEERVKAIMNIKKISKTGIIITTIFITVIIISVIAISAISDNDNTSDNHYQQESNDNNLYEVQNEQESTGISVTDVMSDETQVKPVAVIATTENLVPRFTREELMCIVRVEGLYQLYTVFRQPHNQGEIIVQIEPVIAYGPNYDGRLCDNTYYYIIDGWRVCSTCASVFTKEQDEAIK